MIRGWYIGSSGMNAQQNRLDAISNNLANVDTTGYKKDIAVSKAFSELLLRRTGADGVYKTNFGYRQNRAWGGNKRAFYRF